MTTKEDLAAVERVRTLMEKYGVGAPDGWFLDLIVTELKEDSDGTDQ